MFVDFCDIPHKPIVRTGCKAKGCKAPINPDPKGWRCEGSNPHVFSGFLAYYSFNVSVSDGENHLQVHGTDPLGEAFFGKTANEFHLMKEEEQMGTGPHVELVTWLIQRWCTLFVGVCSGY